MKKLLIFACLILCAIQGQAVTLAWSTGADNSVYTASEDTRLPSKALGESALAASFVMTVHIEKALTDTGVTMATLGMWDHGNVTLLAYGNEQDGRFAARADRFGITGALLGRHDAEASCGITQTKREQI